ncbi:heavy-metal-associated domain-containing protein [Saccharomonospora xinjiangensis]|uniref:heavy-metal-associated domain-containing protein n=1 Tax=Saccharomonospora xinjiangensis TaxID=75294 RepID=UPI0010705F9B|nr:heavy-metal-associated domain-containing protein [Saccharomonospora xinjiangensis]QBQ60320.1 Copper chaperone CopZ [Saccharomonospora xinjiangensis]
MTERTYTVLGMACGHCETFVTEELLRLDAVVTVSVDVAGDAVTVISERALDVSDVRAAVERAGYELVAPAT